MKRTLKCMSALLGYPSAELQAAIGEIRHALADEGALPVASLRRLEPLLRTLETDDLLELQGAYTGLFDGSRSLSLHLFEHVHGESRERGQAMIDLGQQYIANGFAIDANELPDFVPLFLEFLSFLEPAAARDWLGQPAHVFTALGERLVERKSPYAAVFEALLALPKAKADPDALAALRARMAAAEAEPIDETWEEAPISFSTPAGRPGGAGGKSGGITAKIRMALKR